MLFKDQPKENPSILPRPEYNKPEILWFIIEAALKKLKLKKSAKIDGLAVEMSKC